RQCAAWVNDRLTARRIVGQVLVGGVFVGELVAGTAGAVALRVAALQHEQAGPGGHPVAVGAVEVTLLGQADEVVDGAWRLRVVQFDPELALVGLQAHAHHGRVRGHVPRFGRVDLFSGRLVGCGRVLAVGAQSCRRLEGRQDTSLRGGRVLRGCDGACGARRRRAARGLVEEHRPQHDAHYDDDSRGHTGDGPDLAATPLLLPPLEL